MLDIAPDSAADMNKKKKLLRWDAKKRKFVKVRRTSSVCRVRLSVSISLSLCPSISPFLSLSPLSHMCSIYARTQTVFYKHSFIRYEMDNYAQEQILTATNE